MQVVEGLLILDKKRNHRRVDGFLQHIERIEHTGSTGVVAVPFELAKSDDDPLAFRAAGDRKHMKFARHGCRKQSQHVRLDTRFLKSI